MINFTQAFDSAWERMTIILFRPFDPGKWCAIGFGAFLAGLIGGGNGFSYDQGAGGKTNSSFSFSPPATLPHFATTVAPIVAGLQTGVLILFGTAIAVFALALIALIYWLGARGQFLLLDNIVRNRGAIAEPWSFYGRRANQVFYAYLALAVASLGLGLVLIAPALLLFWPLTARPHWPEGVALVAFLGWTGVVAVVFLAMTLLVFLFRDWGIPLMFRQGYDVRTALREVLRLAGEHPGSVAVFVLLRLALGVGSIIAMSIACCCCCFTALPYIGTVALLPVLIYVRCFSLGCLAQFGPAYDVFLADVAPPTGEMVIPPPPRG